MKEKSIKILAIETSCDETAVSVIEVISNSRFARSKVIKNTFILNTSDEQSEKRLVLNADIISNIVSSQIKLHAKYGGVYPELASREHVKNILPVIEKALESNKAISNRVIKQDALMLNANERSEWLKLIANIDAIAVTTGPGLIGSLLPGVNTAKTLSYIFNKPIYAINHIEGHIYSNFVGENLKLPEFPILALVVSGGHTSLILIKEHLKYKIIGETLDDAAGEAFDKVAKLLNLGYPGGPIISQMAEKAISNNRFASNKAIKSNTLVLNSSKRSERLLLNTFRFPRPMIDSGDFDFSFSGLKTSVLYTIKKLPKPLSLTTKQLICKEFQDAVVDTLITKTILAAKKYKVKSILLCGGVAANSCLRQEFKLKIENLSVSPSQGGKLKIDFFVPEKSLCTDNAAMIGIAAAYKIALGKKATPWYNINADANQKLR